MEKLKCEKPVGLNRIKDGGGDTQQLTEKSVSLRNPYEELNRFMCERSSGPSHVEDGGGDAHQPEQL
jgi:hypothetical protein